MPAKHSGVVELARLVADLVGGVANATDRQRAVALRLVDAVT
jgi:cobalamin biosynthesis protein CbiG